MRWPPAQDFLVGANLPWMSYGGDFGANRWHPSGGVGQPDARARLRRALSGLSESGVDAVRWFMLADGRAGLVTSDSGDLAGLDDFVFRDADAALDELDRAGIRAIFVLFDFHWFRRAQVIDGVRTCGRGPLTSDPVRRARLFELALGPLLARYGQHPAVAAWDIINEPEWVTRGTRLPPRRTDLPRRTMRAFIGEAVALVHLVTSHPATVGCASALSLSLVEGLGLDVYQAHWYDQFETKAPLDRPVADLGLDRPVILGEFPTKGSRRTPAEILDVARSAGYAGAFAWSALAEDEATDSEALTSALSAFAAGVGPPRARP
jgi:hypothetical protein